MLPYDWKADPWRWLEQRPEYSCLRLDYASVDGDGHDGRRRPGLRLVRLEPGAPHDPLRCTLELLHSVPVEKNGVSYEAVSYVWGRTDDLVPMRCKTDELESDYSYNWIMITKNCAEVFRHLRYLDKARRVWIDAISIDQEDTADRAHYVRQMHHIYRQAERVIVVLPNFRIRGEGYWAESEPGAWIFTHPYFSRIWILQEVFWGRDPIVYAGQHELMWSEVCNLYHTSQNMDILMSRKAQVSLVLAQGTPRSITKKSQQRSLLELYRMSKFFKATDQRDKIIALISMATDVSPEMETILVDYTVAHEVLLRRFAAVICFRSMQIMPAVERGIYTSQMHMHHSDLSALQRCTDKIDKFMTLSMTDISDLAERLSLQHTEGYDLEVVKDHGLESVGNVLVSVLEKMAQESPYQSRWDIPKAIGFLAVGLGVGLVSAAYWGTDGVVGERLYPGAQSGKMTLRQLLKTIEEARILVDASHSVVQAGSQFGRPKHGILTSVPSRSESFEDRITVRAVILGHQPFDLCLVPGTVNGLHCKRVLVGTGYDAAKTPKPPVPLLLRTGLKSTKVLGSFYDFESIPERFAPSCCNLPIIKASDAS